MLAQRWVALCERAEKIPVSVSRRTQSDVMGGEGEECGVRIWREVSFERV